MEFLNLKINRNDMFHEHFNNPNQGLQKLNSVKILLSNRRKYRAAAYHVLFEEVIFQSMEQEILLISV